MTRHSESFKDAIVNKIVASDSVSIRSVAKEYSIPIATVLGWLRQAKSDPAISRRLDNIMQEETELTVENKFKILIESAAMSAEELSAYCRSKDIYVQDIDIWKQEMLDNLDSRNKQLLTNENRSLKIKLRELESELRCKEKALAETSALLLLKKKARIIWGDDEDEK